MTKARTLADFTSDGSLLADGQISVAEVVGAAPLANPTFTGTVTSTGNIVLGDSDKAIFGTSPNTLSIYNDASNSYIDETGTGNLRIRGNNIQLEQSTGGELYMQAAADGTVRLYYDGQQRLFTSDTGIQVESDSAAAQIIIKSTEGGAGDGPRLDLYRASATPADNDDIGQIYFSGANSAGGKSQYAKVDTFIESPADGAETARLDINLLSVGDSINMFRLRTDQGGAAGEVVVNDSSRDVNFRVESDNSQSALKVYGDTGNVTMSKKVGIQNTAPNALLHVGDASGEGSASAPAIQIGGNTSYRLGFYTGTESGVIDAANGDNGLRIHTKNNGEAFSIDGNGHIKKPWQPAFAARAASAQNNLAENTKMIFGTQLFDQNADYNPSTSQFTAPITGRYVFHVDVRADNIDTAANWCRVELHTSNMVFQHSIIDPGALASDPTYWNFSFSLICHMDAGDTAEVRWGQSGGSTQADLSAPESMFSGYLEV